MTAPFAVLALFALLLAPSVVAAAPPNDECAAATVIKSLPFTRTLAVEGATEDPAAPEPSCGFTDPMVWFAYTARTDVSLELETTGDSSGVAVYRGDCETLTALACNDDTPTNAAQGHLAVMLRKGDTIRIAALTRGRVGQSLTMAVRKSAPRYRAPKSVAEILRSLDPSAYGGSQGTLRTAVAQTEKLTAFAQTTEGIFLDVGGTLTTVTHSGAPAPDGGTFGTFSRPVVTTNAVYFGAGIEGDGPIRGGIFRWNGTSLAPHLQAGDPGPAGSVLSSVARGIAVSPSETLAFVGRTEGDPNAKLMRYDGATVAVMAERGAATACGQTLRTFDSATAINAAGTIAFVATLQNSDKGLFVTDGVTLTTIACGDAATPLGGTFRDFRVPPAINDLGEVYFTTVNDDVSTEAIWRYAAGVTTAVATRGMVLATGEAVTRLPRTQTLATDPLGNVAFIADLTGGRRAVVRREALAPLPSAIVKEDDACPLGGTFDGLDAELALSAGGELVFSGRCSGGAGAFRKPVAAPPTVIVTDAAETALGSGFGFERVAVDAAGTRTVAVGARTTLQSLRCDAKGCAAPVGVLPAGASIANAPGRALGAIDTPTLAGNAHTLAFFGSTVGATRRDGVLQLKDGELTAVASVGDPLPGGIGTFAAIPAPRLEGSVADVGVGKNGLAFTASLDHPTAQSGIFATTPDGLVTVALAGDPAARGGTYEEFDAAVARGRSIMFVAETDETTCVFAAKAVGKAIAAVACEDDPLPPPFDGTISRFVTAPTGTATDLYVVAELSAGLRQCLLRYRNGRAHPVRCRDDVFPRGEFYGVFTDRDIEPAAGVDGKGLVFAARADISGSPAGHLTLFTSRPGVLVPALVADVTPAPASGGTFFEDFDPSAGVAGKSFLTTATIVGGTASSALIEVTLP